MSIYSIALFQMTMIDDYEFEKEFLSRLMALQVFSKIERPVYRISRHLMPVIIGDDTEFDIYNMIYCNFESTIPD